MLTSFFRWTTAATYGLSAIWFVLVSELNWLQKGLHKEKNSGLRFEPGGTPQGLDGEVRHTPVQ